MRTKSESKDPWLIGSLTHLDPVGFRGRPGSPLVFAHEGVCATQKQPDGTFCFLSLLREKPKGIVPRFASALSGLRLARDDRVIIVFYFVTLPCFRMNRDSKTACFASGLSDPGEWHKGWIDGRVYGRFQSPEMVCIRLEPSRPKATPQGAKKFFFAPYF